MASSITITVGTKSYTKTFNKTDAEVRQILRNFGAMYEPALPEGATVQQEVDNIGDKIVKLIVEHAISYDIQTRRRTSNQTIEQEAKDANQL